MSRFVTCAALATAALLMLSGCAGNPINYAQRHADQGHYDGDPSRSRALNVAIATGLTECESGQCAPLADVPRSKLPESMQGVSNVDMIDDLSDAWSVGHGVAQMAGMADALTGLSGMASGMLSIGSFLLEPGEMKDPALVPTIVAWMPKSMASDPSAAQTKMMSIVSQALPGGVFQGYQVDVDQYAESSLAATFTQGSGCNSQTTCAVDINPISEPVGVKTSPDWLHGGPAYAWTNWKRGQTAAGGFNHIWLDVYRVDTESHDYLPWPNDLNARAYLAQVSANLPAWAYIYLPPDDTHGYPVMLNQGKPLLFIEPVEEDLAVR